MTQRPNRPLSEPLVPLPRFKSGGEEALQKIAAAWAERITLSALAGHDSIYEHLATVACLISKCCFEEAGPETAASIVELIASDCRLVLPEESDPFRRMVVGYCGWFSVYKEPEKRRRVVEDFTEIIKRHCPRLPPLSDDDTVAQ